MRSLRREFDVVPQDLPFAFVIDRLGQTDRSHLPVVEDRRRMLGVVERGLSRRFLPERASSQQQHR